MHRSAVSRDPLVVVSDMVTVRWPDPPQGFIRGAPERGSKPDMQLEFRGDGPNSTLRPPIASHGHISMFRGSRWITVLVLGPPDAPPSDEVEVVWGPAERDSILSAIARCGECELLVTAHGVHERSVVNFVNGVAVTDDPGGI
jgi:hypothetical protein